jgi:hypothetical protein
MDTPENFGKLPGYIATDKGASTMTHPTLGVVNSLLLLFSIWFGFSFLFF